MSNPTPDAIRFARSSYGQVLIAARIGSRYCSAIASLARKVVSGSSRSCPALVTPGKRKDQPEGHGRSPGTPLPATSPIRRADTRKLCRPFPLLRTPEIAHHPRVTTRRAHDRPRRRRHRLAELAAPLRAVARLARPDLVIVLAQLVVQDRPAFFTPLRLMREPVESVRLPPPIASHPAHVAAFVPALGLVVALPHTLRAALNQLDTSLHAGQTKGPAGASRLVLPQSLIRR